MKVIVSPKNLVEIVSSPPKILKMKILFFVLAMMPIALKAQITQEIRKEIDVKDNGVDKVIVVGENGLIVHGYVNEKGAPDVLQITAYSTEFEELNTLTREYPKKLAYASSILTQDNAFLYFFYVTKAKEIICLSYNTENYNLTEKSGKLEQAFTPRSIRVMKNKLFVMGFVKNIPTLLIYDPSTGSQRFETIPGINKKRSIESYDADDTQRSMAVFCRDGKDMKLSSLNLIIYDEDGNQIKKPIALDKSDEYSVIDGRVTWLNETDFILAGTYGTKKSSLASGIYFSKFTDFDQDFITYHSFTEFENFFKYLPAKTQKKIEKKKSKKSAKGDEDFIKSFVAVHPVFIGNGEYTFVGEVYYPTYRTETYTTYVNGKATTSTRQVFDGYQYSHAVVLGLDDEGNKLYDHCFSMYLSHKPFSVVLNLRIVEKENILKMFYSTGSVLKAAYVEGGEISEKEFGAIVADIEGDKVRWTGYTNSSYWYENYYVVHGMQRIKNKENDAVEKKRTIFFLSKISFEE